MKYIYQNILESISKEEKLLAILIDPDKMKLEDLAGFMLKLNQSLATHIFVGGSIVEDNVTETLVLKLKTFTNLPIVLFPGDVSQITKEAHALLFLSLISGRNADYLIGKHVTSVSKLKSTDLQVIPTGYILIENGKETAVERVTQTKPIPKKDIQTIVDTARAGELLGMKLIYLEAGSGAIYPVTSEIITNVKIEIQCPLIVGGGIKTKQQLNQAYNAGADMVVIGTAFEEDLTFFEHLKKE